MNASIFAGTVYTGKEILHHQVLRCEKGSIVSIQPGKREEAQHYAENISAGLMDIHINGGRKFYLTQSPNVEAIHDIATSCEEEGTAYTLPTLITSPFENVFKGLEATRNYLNSHPHSGVLGIHLEGPFLNPIKRGAHLPEYLQAPSNEALDQIITRGKGLIRMMTIAPELFTKEQLDKLLQSGITISAGHSNATYQEAQAAFDAGITLVTHLYNAMSGFNHRNPGLAGGCFVNDQVYAPIILDGFHCDYAAAKIAYKIKKEKLFLISDALFVGDDIKKFNWGNFNVQRSGGRYINSENNLAGATISLAEGLRNGVNELNIPIQEAIEMATIRPAKALGIEKQFGSVAVGYPAVFTTFDKGLKKFSVVRL